MQARHDPTRECVQGTVRSRRSFSFNATWTSAVALACGCGAPENGQTGSASFAHEQAAIADATTVVSLAGSPEAGSYASIRWATIEQPDGSAAVTLGYHTVLDNPRLQISLSIPDVIEAAGTVTLDAETSASFGMVLDGETYSVTGQVSHAVAPAAARIDIAGTATAAQTGLARVLSLQVEGEVSRQCFALGLPPSHPTAQSADGRVATPEATLDESYSTAFCAQYKPQ